MVVSIKMVPIKYLPYQVILCIYNKNYYKIIKTTTIHVTTNINDIIILKKR